MLAHLPATATFKGNVMQQSGARYFNYGNEALITSGENRAFYSILSTEHEYCYILSILTPKVQCQSLLSVYWEKTVNCASNMHLSVNMKQHGLITHAGLKPWTKIIDLICYW